MDKNEKIEVLKITIWFNLLIGFYNLYIFNELNSIFHLLLGALNVGVWVFFRQKYLDFSFSTILRSVNSKRTTRDN